MNAIYICIDRNYEQYAKACFNSIVANYPDHPIVLIYANNLSPEFTSYVNTLKNFKIIPYVQEFSHENVGPVENNIVYNKYRLWSNEFDEYDKVLHIDADVLILNPLDEIFKEDFFIVTNDFLVEQGFLKNDDQNLMTMLKEDNITYSTKMANAGVFVISKKYRNKKQFNELVYLTNRYGKYLSFADQSVITLWCHKNNILISTRLTYNYQPGFLQIEQQRNLNNIKILHFTARKPDTVEFLLWWLIPPKLISKLVSLYNKYK